MQSCPTCQSAVEEGAPCAVCGADPAAANEPGPNGPVVPVVPVVPAGAGQSATPNDPGPANPSGIIGDAPAPPASDGEPASAPRGPSRRALIAVFAVAAVVIGLSVGIIAGQLASSDEPAQKVATTDPDDEDDSAAPEPSSSSSTDKAGSSDVDGAATEPAPSTTAATTVPTTTTAPVLPIDQLAGLRPYYAGEVCRAALAVLNSPNLDQAVKADLGFGFTERTADSGVIAVNGAIQQEAFGSEYDSHYFLSPSAASKVDRTAYFAKLQETAPAPGDDNFYGEVNRNPDGSYRCEERSEVSGAGM